jgi:hypothetical protein
MKKSLMRAALLALATVGAAQAVPIELIVSGTRFDGQRATGTFEFDTSGLLPLRFADQQSYSNLLSLETRSTPFRATYQTESGTEVLGDVVANDYGYVSFMDACQPQCSSFAIESFNVSVLSLPAPFGQPYPPGGVERIFSFSSMSPFDPVAGIFTDYFDIDDITVDSVLTMPLREMRLYYQEGGYDCSSGTCIMSITRSDTVFVDSVIRRVRSVPEPGTLGLFGAGLAAAFVLRRRRFERGSAR